MPHTSLESIKADANYSAYPMDATHTVYLHHCFLPNNDHFAVNENDFAHTVFVAYNDALYPSTYIGEGADLFAFHCQALNLVVKVQKRNLQELTGNDAIEICFCSNPPDLESTEEIENGERIHIQRVSHAIWIMHIALGDNITTQKINLTENCPDLAPLLNNFYGAYTVYAAPKHAPSFNINGLTVSPSTINYSESWRLLPILDSILGLLSNTETNHHFQTAHILANRLGDWQSVCIADHDDSSKTTVSIECFKDGVPLSTHIRKVIDNQGNALFPIDNILLAYKNALLAICYELKKMHAKGVLHGDISDDNVLIQSTTHDGKTAQANILDLGQGRLLKKHAKPSEFRYDIAMLLSYIKGMNNQFIKRYYEPAHPAVNAFYLSLLALRRKVQMRQKGPKELTMSRIIRFIEHEFVCNNINIILPPMTQNEVPHWVSLETRGTPASIASTVPGALSRANSSGSDFSRESPTQFIPPKLSEGGCYPLCSTPVRVEPTATQTVRLASPEHVPASP